MQLYDPQRLAQRVIESFRDGRRTVSYRDFCQQYGREEDADFIERIVDLMPEIQRLVEGGGYPCTLVNAFCVRQYAEIAITDEATARRCNVFNSGGKQPVGIRRALPDDLVRTEVHGSAAHLGIGQIKHAVVGNGSDVLLGISTPTTHERLTGRLRQELPLLPELKPEPVQPALMDVVGDVDNTD